MAAHHLIRRAFAAVLLAAIAAGPAAAIDIKLMSGASGLRVLALTGKIEGGDGKRVRAALEKGGFDEVWLFSGGGRESEGYEMGRAFRSFGVIARIPKKAKCASACVDAFMGAPIRFVDDAHAIGVHPASIAGNEEVRERYRSYVTKKGDEGMRELIMHLEQKGGKSAAAWVEYALFMGISPELVTYASSVPHNCALWLSRNEMKYFNVVNTQGAAPDCFEPGDSRKRCH